MNWHINKEGRNTVVVIDREMGIQDASAFYDAVLLVSISGVGVQLDAGAAKSVHSSVMQILYSLSRAVPDFRVTAASADFLAAEVRVGFSLARNRKIEIPSQASIDGEVSCA